MAISKDKKTTLVADLTELLSNSKMVVYAKSYRSRITRAPQNGS